MSTYEIQDLLVKHRNARASIVYYYTDAKYHLQKVLECNRRMDEDPSTRQSLLRIRDIHGDEARYDIAVLEGFDEYYATHCPPQADDLVTIDVDMNLDFEIVIRYFLEIFPSMNGEKFADKILPGAW